MSRTLFWYIFRDLLRIFGLAVGALSAIMSFGGLLRPLYEFGLNIGQVGQILTWSTPAMWAYSLPIGALFATTIVYGRLGADNEITACRAAGFSHLALAIPAMLLGLITALASLGLLCFIVPYSTLQVERIIYSNIADLVVGQIERTHQIRFDKGNNSKPITVFAQRARKLPYDPAHPNDQDLELIGPVIVQYETTRRNEPWIPEDFNMASSASVRIRQDLSEDDVTMSATLTDGTRIPRSFAVGAQKGMQLNVRTTGFGPVALPSPVRENTKFMDIFRLKSLLDVPEQSRRIRSVMLEFIRRDQQDQFLNLLADQLNSPDGAAQISGINEKYEIARGPALAELRKEKLFIGPDADGGNIQFTQVQNGKPLVQFDARAMRLSAFPDMERKQMVLDIELLDCLQKIGDEVIPRGSFARSVSVPMPEEIAAVKSRSAAEYLNGSLSPVDRDRLLREITKQKNSVISELHARTSFAVSCFILVMVGCALGMMFRSGNFLSAFAVSVIPALMCIALIVTGQHTCENVPSPLPAHWNNPLAFGTALIWSGNVLVLGVAVVLLGRLQRQ